MSIKRAPSRQPYVWSALVEIEEGRAWFMHGYNWRVRMVLNGRPDPMVSERIWHGWARSEAKALERGRVAAEKRIALASVKTKSVAVGEGS